ncbi:bifunctional lytic transglycosylase/C40 family peptidase [Streptomyces platensis]|uniref:C40 family peptidase n=1 Tax=Streptomyces platensis TaxID=58346 RepID=UPI00331F99D0
MSGKTIAGALAGTVGVLVLGSAVMASGTPTTPQMAAGTAGLNASAMPKSGQIYAKWYQRAGSLCPGITPALLAAQGKQESAFNPNAKGPATQYGQALGIAQFLPSTYSSYGEDSDQDGHTGPMDPEDAIMAQGKYMCSLYSRAKKTGYSGDPASLALAGYNAGWNRVVQYAGIPPYKETTNYVAVILADAKRWAGSAAAVSGSGAGPDAVRRAAQYLGRPYVWGGGTPEGPSKGFCDERNGYLNGVCFAATHSGFDCSSLTQNAYWPSVKLPRVASDQYNATAGKTVSRGDLKVGDLLFWSHGGAGGIYHVAMYYGNGNIIQAPRTGKNVEVTPISKAMPEGDYYGATRP